jgi:hypothetical protein
MKSKKLQLLAFVIVLFWTAGCYIVEKELDAVPGLFTGCAEVGCELIILGYLLFGKRPKRTRLTFFRSALILSFCLLVFADSSYDISFYLLKLPSTTPLAIWTTSFPYALLNLSLWCAIAPFARRRFGLSPHPWPIIVSTLVILPVAAKLVLHPLFLDFANMSGLFLAMRLFDIPGSILLAITACSLFLRSRHLCWTLLGAAVFGLIFGDWAAQLPTSSSAVPALGVDEFFWAFGVFSIGSILYVPGVFAQSATPYSSNLTAITGTKTGLFLMGFLSTAAYSVLSGKDDLTTIRIVGFSTLISLFVGAFIAHLAIPDQRSEDGGISPKMKDGEEPSSIGDAML